MTLNFTLRSLSLDEGVDPLWSEGFTVLPTLRLLFPWVIADNQQQHVREPVSSRRCILGDVQLWKGWVGVGEVLVV